MSARTKQIGDIGVLKIAEKCLSNGANVSIPFGDNTSYDLIVDKNGKLYRSQVKTAENIRDNNSMIFFTNKTNPYKLTKNAYTADEIDIFFLYCIENQYIGIARVDECKKQFSIHIGPTKSGQKKNINNAEQYAFDNMWVKL